MTRAARVGRSEPRWDALGAHDTRVALARRIRGRALQQKCKVVTSRWFGTDMRGYGRDIGCV